MDSKIELCKSYAKRSIVDIIYRATVVEGLGTTYLKNRTYPGKPASKYNKRRNVFCIEYETCL